MRGSALLKNDYIINTLMEPRSVRKEERNYGENYRLAKNRSLIRHAEPEPSVRGEDMEYVYGHQAKELRKRKAEEKQKELERYYPKAIIEEKLAKRKKRSKPTIEEAIMEEEEEGLKLLPFSESEFVEKEEEEESERPVYSFEEGEEEEEEQEQEEEEEKDFRKSLELIDGIEKSIADLSYRSAEEGEVDPEIEEKLYEKAYAKLKELNRLLYLPSTKKQGAEFIAEIEREKKETENFLGRR
jgi:hypothetical protein